MSLALASGQPFSEVAALDPRDLATLDDLVDSIAKERRRLARQ